jgi:hypothetical protein
MYSNYLFSAFKHMHSCPSRTARLLRQLLAMPATDVWPFADTIIKFFKSTLDDKVPRYIQGKLNSFRKNL